jgi:hypothetical protein
MYSCPFLFLLRFLLIFVLHFACGKYASSLSIVIDFHFFRQNYSVAWREFWLALSSVCIFSSSLTTPTALCEIDL